MASWTTPTTHSAGDTLAVTDWNAVANNTTFLYQAPYASATPSANTTVGTSPTQIGNMVSDFSGYGFSLSSNNLVVPLTGIYQVNANINSGTATTVFVFAYIYQNGGVKRLFFASELGPDSSHGSVGSGSTLLKCTASDTIGLYAFVASSTASLGGYLQAVFTGEQ